MRWWQEVNERVIIAISALEIMDDEFFRKRFGCHFFSSIFEVLRWQVELNFPGNDTAYVAFGKAVTHFPGL